jgi:tyrosinase
MTKSVLHEHVKDYVQGIPDDFEQKPQYVKGAESFRLPYWDWASSGHSSVPDVAMETTDARKNPPPSKTSWFSNNPVYNPLHEYRWPKGAPQDIITDEDTIPESTATVRHPWGPGEDALGKEIDRRDFGARWKALHPGVPEKNLTERTAYILQSYKRYFSMSNNRAPTNGRTPANAEIYGSLEDTHNAVHGLTGGSGHMSDPKVAAFDPIFWLHHA